MKRVAIACGGTGGHLCPGIAIAEELKKNGIDPVLFISRKQIDKVISTRYDQFEYFVTRAMPFSKKPGTISPNKTSFVQSVRKLPNGPMANQ